MEDNYILAKWLNDEITEKEKATLLAESDFEIYEKIKKYTSQLEISDFDEQKMLSTILTSKKKQENKVVPLFSNWMYKIAAVLVLTFGITFLYQNFDEQKQIASNGNKTSFALPDNSEVVLNSGSEIEYRKNNWNRNVKLEGEAYFHVAKGKRFEVATSLGKIAVLGTQFNVKARQNRLDVICFEGRVQVNYNDKQLLLTQGQSVTFENGNQINTIVSSSKPDWLENKIAFDKESLEHIVAEIERSYNIKIKQNSKNSNQLFTGKIPSDNLEVALQIIASTYQLKITKLNSKSIIFE
jgi:transmembrane sensor